MKSINQIFSTNPSLKDEPEVAELIAYCQELEGQVVENRQSNQFSFEDALSSLARDIFSSIKDIEKEQMEHERFDFDKPDYEQAVKNLAKYMRKFAEDTKFRF